MHIFLVAMKFLVFTHNTYFKIQFNIGFPTNGETSTRSGIHLEVERIRKELNQLLEKEEKMWQQRSRVQWLENGDRNTKFFHGIATQRNRQNFIKGLRDEEGVWQNDEHTFSGLLVGFYEKLFASSNPQNMERILNGVKEVVIDSMG